MSFEYVALTGVVLAFLFLVWRESRALRQTKLEKSLRTLKKAVDSLETAQSGLPGAEVLAEFEEKLRIVDQKAGAAPAAALKALVDRVNVLSNDMSAMKVTFDNIQNEFKRLQQAAKWQGVMSKSEVRGE